MSSKSGNFTIAFDSNQDVYHEGDKVTGHIKLNTHSDLKYKCFYVEILGIAFVHWNVKEEIQFEPSYKTKGHANRKDLFYKKITLSEKGSSFLDKNPVFSSGEHSFSFEYKLPIELPSSFEGQFGQIRYLAKATVERPIKQNLVAKKAFTVLCGLDLNFIPEAAHKIEVCKYKEIGNCFSSGTLSMQWNVNRSGFVPGESIRIIGDITNETSTAVVSSKVALSMLVKYKTKKRQRQEQRDVVVETKPLTPAGGITVWNDELQIPPLPSTGLARCQLIDISYELQFSVFIDRQEKPIVMKKDIYIGTRPINKREMNSCVAGLYNQPYNEPTEECDVINSEVIASAPGLETIARPNVSSNIYPNLCEDERPPPYAPAAQSNFQSLNEVLSPTAPSSHTLLRPPNQGVEMSYETGNFSPVNIHDLGDTASIQGDLTFNPHYIYYNYPSTNTS